MMMKIFRGQGFQFLKILLSPELGITILGYLTLYVLVVSMQWPQIGLLIFPIITGTTGIFYAVLTRLKYQIQIPTQPPIPYLVINPFGEELKISRILNLSGLIQLIIIAILGYDSKIHPQLINDYMILYLFILTVVYGFTWILCPIFIYGKSQVGILEYSDVELSIGNDADLPSKPQLRLIQHLSFSDLKWWFYLGLGLLIILEIGFIIDSGIYYFSNDQMKMAMNSGFGSIILKIPGSQTIYGETIRTSLLFWLVLVFSPLIFMIGIILIYHRMWQIDSEKQIRLQNYLTTLPEEQQLVLKKSLSYAGLLAKRE